MSLINIDDVYIAIKEGKVTIVDEYVGSIFNPESTEYFSKVNNFLSVAINFRQMEVTKLLILKYEANPESFNNINMFIAFCKEDLDLYNYLLNGRTFQEYINRQKC